MNAVLCVRAFVERSILLLLACGSVLLFRASGAESLAAVSITTGRAETREFGGDATPAPGTFILHRTGSTVHPLTVFIAYQGTGAPGTDYVRLNNSVVLPIGAQDLTLEVQPIDDTLVEGDETVIARIIPPLTAIVPSYSIDPVQNSATVIIHDNDQAGTTANVTITSPADRAEVPAGVDREVSAIAVDPNGYIPHLEFYLDGALLGVSRIEFLVPPKPGTPITHHVLWKTPTPGAHVLTARGVDANGHIVESAPVHLTVTAGEPTSATLEITSPLDGAVFGANSDIPVTAVAVDPNGYISHVEFYANDRLIGVSDLKFFRAPDPGTPITHEITWSDAPPGMYAVTARAIDTGANKIVSPPVHIMVMAKGAVSFVERKLPSSYTAGEQFEVTLTATPPLGTEAYAIEDTIPHGWIVIGATQDGVFDPATGSVKFGLFFDDKARTLTYRVGVPKNAVGDALFKGVVSAGGVSSSIGGDSTVPGAMAWHPADRNNDHRITINELTGYAAAWKSGAEWTVAPVSIPLTFVTRAAMIWRKGETYHYDSSFPAPLCWVPDSASVKPGITPPIASRLVQVDPATGNIQITLHVQPPTNGEAVAIEERLPAGCVPMAIGDGGMFSPGVIRSGPTFGTVPITFSYVLPPDMSDLSKIAGFIGVDGQVFAIDSNRPRITSLERANDSSLKLHIQGPDEQAYVLESSADLNNWTEEAPVFLPSGELSFSAAPNSGDTQRFYRLRSR